MYRQMRVTMDEIVMAKTSEEILADLIARFQKFILICAYRTSGRYISVNDDEYSAALIGFSEAVQSYDEAKGNFNSFASIVIRRRVLDYQKGIRRYSNEHSVPTEILDGQIDPDCTALEKEVRSALCTAGLSSEERDIKGEIEEIQITFEEYGFSFYDLIECSPKSQKTKEACGKLILALTGSDELMKKMRRTMSLPIAEITEITGIRRRTAERHRRYIIAAAEILTGDYPLLRSYVPYR